MSVTSVTALAAATQVVPDDKGPALCPLAYRQVVAIAEIKKAVIEARLIAVYSGFNGVGRHRISPAPAE